MFEMEMEWERVDEWVMKGGSLMLHELVKPGFAIARYPLHMVMVIMHL